MPQWKVTCVRLDKYKDQEVITGIKAKQYVSAGKLSEDEEYFTVEDIYKIQEQNKKTINDKTNTDLVDSFVVDVNGNWIDMHANKASDVFYYIDNKVDDVTISEKTEKCTD